MTQLSGIGGLPRDPQAPTTRTKRALRRLVAEDLLGPSVHTLQATATVAGNSGIAETTIGTYTLPPKYLAMTPGDFLEVEWLVSFAGNANTKRLKVKWGSQMVYDSTALAQNGGAVIIRLKVFCLTQTTQQVVVEVIATAGATLPGAVTYTAGSQDATAAIIVLLTGQSGAAGNDILMQAQHVRLSQN